MSKERWWLLVLTLTFEVRIKEAQREADPEPRRGDFRPQHPSTLFGCCYSLDVAVGLKDFSHSLYSHSLGP